MPEQGLDPWTLRLKSDALPTELLSPTSRPSGGSQMELPGQCQPHAGWESGHLGRSPHLSFWDLTRTPSPGTRWFHILQAMGYAGTSQGPNRHSNPNRAAEGASGILHPKPQLRSQVDRKSVV